METSHEQLTEQITPIALQRLWARRLNGSIIHEESDIAELLQDSGVFPSAQVEGSESDSKSRACSPSPFQTDCCFSFYEHDVHEDVPGQTIQEQPVQPQIPEIPEATSLVLDGSVLRDIPAVYKIPPLLSYELPVVGVWVDPRVVPGFKYRVRPLDMKRGKYLFGGRALELQSIGRGYSRRITFQADDGTLNKNDNYFWSDSRPDGFAFELEAVSTQEKYTIHDANHVPIGTLEVINSQAPQEEVAHAVLKDGSIEKTVRVRILCKVEWFEDNGAVVIPVKGVAVIKKSKTARSASVVHVIRATVGIQRGATLIPGINFQQRTTVVSGQSIGDIPTRYTIIGLEPYEMPVIGTYIDPRIVPGFEYRVRLAINPGQVISNQYLFGGETRRLVSIGAGYGKRITFAPDCGSLNDPKNFFWSDTHPDGVGFEPRAVHVGQRFCMSAGDFRLGEAIVFRADAPQCEEKQELIKGKAGTTVVKHIHIDVKCHVTLDTAKASVKEDEVADSQVMRISGTAIVSKAPRESAAKLLRIENIGLASQLNLLSVIQQAELVFYPI